MTTDHAEAHRQHFTTGDCLVLIEQQLGLIADRLNLMDDRIRVIGTRTTKGFTHIMALIDDIKAAIDAEDADIVAAANRVIDTINANNAALQAAADQIAADAVVIADLEAQIAAGIVTPEAAQAVLDAIASARTQLAAIDTAPVEPIPTP